MLLSSHVTLIPLTSLSFVRTSPALPAHSTGERRRQEIQRAYTDVEQHSARWQIENMFIRKFQIISIRLLQQASESFNRTGMRFLDHFN